MNPLSMRFFRTVIYLSLAAFMAVGTGCKGKKKVAETTTPEPVVNTENDRLNRIKDQLTAMYTSPPSRSIQELEGKERRLKDIKDLGLSDPEVVDLIRKVEEKLASERTILENEAKRKREQDKKGKVTSALNDIINAGNTSMANMKIAEALELFSSEDSPVLIIIHQSAGIKDYDRPTTIKKYLNYLKDQRKNPNEVNNVIYDASGKIKELELIKIN
ncbi:MAG: hypothetical protein AAGC85_19745 [Bacteroidota bacterium]